MSEAGGEKSGRALLLGDLRKMLPVWIVVTVAAVGSLAAVRLSGVNYLRRGAYSHADTCQVAEIHFQAGTMLWRAIAADAKPPEATQRLETSLGIRRGDERVAEARAKFHEALRLCPHLAGAHELLADLAWWDGDQALTHYHLGMEHLRAREINEARIELQAAWQLAPADTAIAQALLDVITRQERWDEVGEFLDSASPELRESPEALRAQAHLAGLEGNRELATMLLRQALDTRPGWHPAVADLVRYEGELGNYLDAGNWLMTNIDKAVAPEAHDYHGVALLFEQGGHDEQALEAIDRALAIANHSILLMMEKALVLSRLGRYEEAKLMVEAALDTNAHEFLRILQEKRFESLGQYR